MTRKSGKPGMSRRKALRNLGVSLSALTVGCASKDAGFLPTDDPTEEPPTPTPPDLSVPEDFSEALPQTPQGLLAGIDAVVVLMMENRSFDHYFGSLNGDTRYPGARRPDGLTGKETNPDKNGRPVGVSKLENYEPKDPPHGFESSHAQWNGGKNDGFVREYIDRHGEKIAKEVMGYHDRSQLPYLYALADRYTVCDRFFASVMGPTWPNRYYLHAGTSGGKKDNTPYVVGGPTTLWERLLDKKLTGKNYFAGPVAWYWGAYPGKLLTLNPTQRLDAFFTDCKNGTLPSLSIIDPDFLTSDDHPSHNIQLGQVFLATVLTALFQSPQWSRCLFVLTYDEHGGFFDHVSPPRLKDEHTEFQQVGFRVPSLLIGPTVRRGFVDSTQYDHTSVGATLRTRFGLDDLSLRMAAAHDFSAAIDPYLAKHPAPPPTDLPRLSVNLTELASWIGADSQPELTAAVNNLPPHIRRGLPLSEKQTPKERVLSWLQHAPK